MATNALLILSLLTIILSSQAMLFSTDLVNGTCYNNNITVKCNSTTDHSLHPETCCQLGDGFICCDDLPAIVGIIVGAIVAFCVVCVFIPLLVVICCCCCFMGTLSGKITTRGKIVRSGYQRV